MKLILSKIDEHDVISFDIFDTLITRKCLSPRDIFVQVEKKFKDSYPYSNKVNNFRAWRIKAEQIAEEKAYLAGSEECTFNEIYEEVQSLLGLSDLEVEELKCYELEAELESVVPREIGLKLLDYSIARNKKVFFISDMYLNRENIIELLKKANIPVVDEIFVSSEIGRKKKTGTLYDYVCKKENIDPRTMLHIGDNELGDYRSALNAGLRACRIPRAIDIAKSDKNLCKHIEYFQNNRHILSDIYLSLVLRKYYDNPEVKYRSLFEGSAYRFGYIAFSILAVSFAIWIHEQVKEKKLEKLFFLSRDMKIIYDIYNKLYPSENTQYIYSSRRSVKVPMLSSRADLLEPIFNKPVYSNTIGGWLNFNYGLSEDSEVLEVLRSFGIPDFDFKIGNKFDKQKLESIVITLQDKIFAESEKEHELLLDYLKKVGINSKSKNIAVIDIGYAASMQSAYMHILKNKNIFGLYFGTFHTALQKLKSPSMASGYVCNYASPKSSGQTISTHRFLLETIFCDTGYSFKNFVKDSETGIVQEVFDIMDYDDSDRFFCINDIHEGVLDFTDDLVNIYGSKEVTSLDPVSASKVLDEYINAPNSIEDIQIFSGVRFHDGEAPSVTRYIIPPSGNFSADAAIWKEGFNFLSKKPKQSTQAASVLKKKKAPEKNKAKNKALPAPSIDSNVNHKSEFSQSIYSKIEKKVLQRVLDEKKFNKYKRDRKSFFLDSKMKISKLYYRSTDKLNN